MDVPREFGPNIYLMFLILSGVGAAFWWIAQNILIPVRDAHTKFLDKLDVHLAKLAAEQEKLTDTTDQISKKMDTIVCRGQSFVRAQQ